jgi:hypothetical protein
MDRSLESNVLYSCDSCGHNGKHTLRHVYANEYDLRVKVLNGEQFKFYCIRCGAPLHPNFNFTYEDRERKFVIMYSTSECKEIIEFFKIAFPDDRYGTLERTGKKYRLVDSQLALREKIIIFEKGLDDRVIELIKWIIKQNEQNSLPSECKLYFEKLISDEYSNNKGKLIFNCYINNQMQNDEYIFEKEKYDILLKHILLMERLKHPHYYDIIDESRISERIVDINNFK